ncbi:receptor-like serine/threonine-protein kinase SD1-8 [Humulus lupulus]|uniref:receptor-like serine/threonine-protein kinase SD1-8 n=1 Tax=Humulus lupulus TaxID=3486 RepID=UPI002B400D4B|nr:receptor-like serine/threonine-protein kinase SD1-8 [Humulus lupulus]
MGPLPKHSCPFLFAIFGVAFLTLFPHSTASSSVDSLSSIHSLSNDQTLVSAGQDFELGFFKPGASGWYLGIWYKKLPVKTYVWVANRDAPLANSSATLKFGDHGILVLLDSTGNLAWSSSNKTRAVSPVLQLLDSGNLVVREENDNDPEKFLWQSFDFPTDTLLPGMKLGWDLRTGVNRNITSWRSSTDPSTGDYSFSLDYRGFPEIFLRSKQEIAYRSGPWNGERFSGVPEMNPVSGLKFEFVTTQQEVYYSFLTNGSSIISRLFVNPSGFLERYTWIESSQSWSRFWYAPKDQCDNYRECGVYGICDSNASPVCQCPKGFAPKNPQAWNLRDGSDGCLRKTKSECDKDKFLTMKKMKLPESSTAFVDRNMNIEECRKKCLANCSCTAFANAVVSNGGSGCVMWSSDLIDLRDYAEGGQVLFLRLAASDLDSDWTTKRIIIIVAVAVGGCILLLGLFLVWKRKGLRNLCKGKSENRVMRERSQDFLLNDVVISKKEFYSGERDKDELELPLLDYTTIAVATNNFSDDNKLGQGGFGCVYKGILEEEQIVAVKRLSKNSGQGVEEFKNEVRLIARLQHINLVRLLGCCVEMDEKMLIYEYMENRSLDSVLFSKVKRSLLDWPKRFNIICGIARGLLYLHQDSRFRIIHRDLKASNILLDAELAPKISDFGMARIFGRDQTEANTLRVVGTYGYMAPEYAMDGLFSVKSDAFSFGVLVLEIISGKKNRGFYYANNELNLLGYAWNLWKEGKALEIVDSSVGDSYSASEVMRCIQVGLLCVQERAEDRPTMSTVVLMLSSETATMPQPKNPGFCLDRSPMETDSSTSKQEDQSFTVNRLTVTVLDGR